MSKAKVTGLEAELALAIASGRATAAVARAERWLDADWPTYSVRAAALAEAAVAARAAAEFAELAGRIALALASSQGEPVGVELDHAAADSPEAEAAATVVRFR